jgi:hypothetical protein
MTQQAELIKNIDTLPPKYLGEVIDFVAYLQKKAQQEAAQRAAAAEREKEYINRNAERLNKEAMDVLSYQWPGFSEEKLREMESVNSQARELNNGSV